MYIVKYFTALSITAIALTVQAQPATRLVREANMMFDNENYCEATDKIEAAYKQISRKGKKAQLKKGALSFKVAESYRQTERYKEAQEWYERAELLEYQEVEPKILYYLALCYSRIGDESGTLKYIERYKKYVPKDPMTDVLEMTLKNVKAFKANRSRHIIENQRQINKPEFDMSPVFGDRKESKLFFSSSRPGSTGGDTDPRSCEGYMDIWVSQQDKKGNWGEPSLIVGDSINTEDNEGTVCFDGRNKTMFFTRCPNAKKMNLGCDIYMSEAKGKDEWGIPVKVNIKSADSISVGHPCSSEDGRSIIFASDMPGGIGGRDLWWSSYDKKTNIWSTPVNLGPEINTVGDELFPSFAKNGDLLFSSNGHPGMGGLDIFRAIKVGDEWKWENPENLGFPINSESADYSMYELDEKKGYFTSERKGENGDLKPDIYSYDLPDNLFDLRVIVSELGNKSQIVAGVKVTVSGSDGSKFDGVTNEKGTVVWDKKPNGDRYILEESSYNILIGKAGYVEDRKGTQLTTKGLKYGQTFIMEMSLLPIKPIRLPEVRYPLGSAVLLVDSTINSKDSLNFVYDLLTEYPGMVLELSSHTDARGSDESNQTLSEARAKSCVDYLVIEKGINPLRLVPVGKGEREPAEYKLPETGEVVKLTEAFINQFKTTDPKKFELLHQINRRTEGRVLNMDFE
ncbi:MAG: OmpA family protein [Bacteroidetes bacterium]|nr:OmpA family protein [Bacteroidota bacterium]